jgi:hypothetical protein
MGFIYFSRCCRRGTDDAVHAHNSSDSAEADASDSGDAAMDEEEFVLGGMEIDDDSVAATTKLDKDVVATEHAPIDEDMSEVAEIMLNLKVTVLESQSVDLHSSDSEAALGFVLKPCHAYGQVICCSTRNL